MASLWTALRWLSLPVLAVILQTLAFDFWHAVRAQGISLQSLAHPLAMAFAGGLLFRILLAAVLRKLGRDDPFEFIDTLEHELTHALVGYLTFSPPVSLTATLRSGGEVELKGGNPLAILAPYYLPLWCLLALAFGMIVKPDLHTIWTYLEFFLLGSFLFRLAREYGWRQTDLHAYGFPFSTVLILILLFLSLAVILHGRGLLPWRWLRVVPADAWHTALWGWDKIRALV